MRSSSVLELGTGLRQLSMLAERHVAEHDELSAAEIADRSPSAAAVPAVLREDAIRQLGGFTADYRQRIQAHLDQLDPGPLGEKVTDPMEWMAAQTAGLIEASLPEALAAVNGLPPDSPALVGYLMQYSLAAERRPLLPVIRRALLITAVASSETTLIGVLRRRLYDQDGADQWGPYRDTPDLDQRVRKLTRGSIHDWVPRLASELDVDLPAATCDWAAVTEIWARRHVLVHNGGLADHKYAERVPGAVAGVLLDVDGEYLDTAIGLLSGFVLSVIFQTWVRQPGRQHLVARLADLHATTAAAEPQWPLAENLHQFAADHHQDHEDGATSQVNAWLARAHWRGTQSVTADASQWPVAELPKRYALARHILLGQTENALAMLPALLADGEVNIENLQTWPIFGPLRELPSFQQLLADPQAGSQTSS